MLHAIWLGEITIRHGHDPEARSAAEVLGCAAYFRKTDSGKEVLDTIRRVAL